MAKVRRNVEFESFINTLQHSELKLFRNAEKSTIKLLKGEEMLCPHYCNMCLQCTDVLIFCIALYIDMSCIHCCNSAHVLISEDPALVQRVSFTLPL